jgi:ligand-binding sensor domain-containing protein
MRLMIYFMIALNFALGLAASECSGAEPYVPVRPDPMLESWRWRVFPELSGLSLECMAEDSDGNLWFGVSDGAVRYDGIVWTHFTSDDGLAGAPVVTLCASKDGGVYAGTSDGISRFKDGAWSRVFPAADTYQWHIYDIVEASDGSLWAGTDWGPLRLTQGRPLLLVAESQRDALRALFPQVELSVLPPDAGGMIEWSNEGIGVQMFGEPFSSGTVVNLAPEGPAGKGSLEVGDRILAVDGRDPVDQSMVEGPAGTQIRLSVLRKGQLKPFEVALTHAKPTGHHASVSVWDIMESTDGAVWFGLRMGHVLRYDSGVWRRYTDSDGIDVGVEARLSRATDRTLWSVSCSFGFGVNRLVSATESLDVSWVTKKLSDLGGSDINNSILALTDETVWVGGYEGHIHVYHAGAWTVYRAPDVPIPTARIQEIIETSDGALWFAGKYQEAVRLDRGKKRWESFDGLTYQCSTRDTSRWFLTRDHRVVRATPASHDAKQKVWIRYGYEDGLIDSPVRLAVTRGDVVWAVGSHKGIVAAARFDGKVWTRQLFPQLSWSIDERAVFEAADGSLWFGAAADAITASGQVGGVQHYDPSARVWSHHQPPSALLATYGVGQTDDGDIWTGSYGGLRRLHEADKLWSTITEPSQMQTADIDVIHTGLKTGLWIGTRGRRRLSTNTHIRGRPVVSSRCSDGSGRKQNSEHSGDARRFGLGRLSAQGREPV